jgi:pyrroloquinoline quinone biosynthesis protein B
MGGGSTQYPPLIFIRYILHLKVIGVAAGGGYPQWNCACEMCQRVRESGIRAPAQLHASLAVSGSGENWYLVNATPDVRFQIESFPALHPGPGLRETRLRGVLLTDAEFDHSIGLLILREGSPLDIYGTPAVLATLKEIFPIEKMVQSYAPFRWVSIDPDRSFGIDGDRLRITAFRLGVKRPRYTAGSEIDGDWVIGYRFEDLQTGGRVLYAPAIEAWTPILTEELARTDCAFVDGTFWSEDEMIRIGASTRTAKEMGHIPINGPEGSVQHLMASAGPRGRRLIYIHINNTNPILDENSAERRMLVERGIEIGRDGLELEV